MLRFRFCSSFLAKNVLCDAMTHDKVASLQQTHGHFTYGGNKLDRNLLNCAGTVMKHVDAESEKLLCEISSKYGDIFSHGPTRLKHIFKSGPDVATFTLGVAMSLLARKVGRARL